MSGNFASKSTTNAHMFLVRAPQATLTVGLALVRVNCKYAQNTCRFHLCVLYLKTSATVLGPLPLIPFHIIINPVLLPAVFMYRDTQSLCALWHMAEETGADLFKDDKNPCAAQKSVCVFLFLTIF